MGQDVKFVVTAMKERLSKAAFRGNQNRTSNKNCHDSFLVVTYIFLP